MNMVDRERRPFTRHRRRRDHVFETAHPQLGGFGLRHCRSEADMDALVAVRKSVVDMLGDR
jgi:hypothetical protein